MEEKKMKKLTVGGPCADTNKDFPQRLMGNQGFKDLAIGPLTSLTYSTAIAFSFYFSSANNIMREKNCITLTR